MKRTPLLRKTPLNSKKKRKPRRSLEQKTRTELIKEADKVFSRYVRLRDSEFNGTAWVGPCITCSRPLSVLVGDKWNRNTNLGHFVTRGTHGLRFDERNCNLQCAHCNAWADKQQMIINYREALDRKYGEGTANELAEQAKRENNGEPHKLYKPELLQIIHDSKVRLEYMLENK